MEQQILCGINHKSGLFVCLFKNLSMRWQSQSFTPHTG